MTLLTDHFKPPYVLSLTNENDDLTLMKAALRMCYKPTPQRYLFNI